MITNNKELEQIAKQVSLLNRLIDLLRIQEAPEPKDLEAWFFTNNAQEYNFIRKECTLINEAWIMKGTTIFTKTMGEAWNHPITQKAWSDEFVQVARELLSAEVNKWITMLTKDLYDTLKRQDLIPYTIPPAFTIYDTLAAILNRYGRSFGE